MPNRLSDQLYFVDCGLSGISLLGKVFRFTDPRDEMVGTITGIRTTDDGLPFLEVSNKTFSGLEVRGIILDKDKGLSATLLTTAPEPEYSHLKGIINIYS